MGPTRLRATRASFVMIITCICVLFAGGCARYAHTVNAIYEPAATVSGGTGEVYIVIPESRQTGAPDIKWVLGAVKDYDNRIIDEVTSSRSPAEIIQAAFGQELKKAGYTVIPVTKRPAAEPRVIDLTKTEIKLEQVSDFAGLKATCRVLVGIDLYKNGQQIKRFQYESSSSRSDLRDRDLLAGNVLEEALKSVMLEAMPALHAEFNPVIHK